MLLVSSNAAGKRVDQHKAAIDAARDAGVTFIAYTSVSHADSALMKGVVEHRQTEEYLRSVGVPFTILRNSWYFENYLALLPLIQAAGAIYGMAGDGRASGALRAEYAEAAAAVLTGEDHEGKVYELGGDAPYSLAELAEAVSERLGRSIPYVDLPEEELVPALKASGMPDFIVPVLLDTHAGAARGELFTGTRDLSRLIGRPTTSLRQTLADTTVDSDSH
ncbi:NmrA family NAD(P)-binding protein [Streptomyces sp. NPDC059396]|uniref:NmrA family NAD(P)-binding protein n=1 Tax=Streptomyces sp. NPDC059396 TaxID=3346819 RepID=UPI0036A39AB1